MILRVSIPELTTSSLSMQRGSDKSLTILQNAVLRAIFQRIMLNYSRFISSDSDNCARALLTMFSGFTTWSQSKRSVQLPSEAR